MKRNEPTMESTGLWEMDESAAVVEDNNDDRELLTKETASGSQSSNCSQTESSSSTSHQTSTANSPSRDNTINDNNNINDTTTTTRSTSSSFSSFAMRSSLQEMSAVLGEGELPARTSFASHASRRLSSQQSSRSNNSKESIHSQHENNHPNNNNNDHSTNSHSHSMSTSIMSISLRQLRSRKGSFGSSTSIVLTESQLFGNDDTTTASLDHMHLPPHSPKRRSRKWNQQESMHKSRNAEQESTNALWNESQLSLMQSVSILDVVDQHVQPAMSISTASSKNKNQTSTQPTSPKDSDTVSSSSASSPLQLQSCLKKPTSTTTTATKKHARFAVNPETDRAWTLIRTFAPDHHPGLWWSMDDRQVREEEDEDMADEYEVLYGDILESAYEAAMELQDTTNNNTTPSYDDLTLDSQLTQDNLVKCMDARGLEAACYSIEEYVQEAREAILKETDQQRTEQARNVSLEYSFPLQLVMHRLAVLEHALLVAAENSDNHQEETESAPSSASSATQNNTSLESGQSKLLARLQEEEDDSEASDSVASLSLESAALDAEMGISNSSAHSHATNGPSSQHPESRLSVLAEVANESHSSGGMTDFHGESSSNDSKSVVVTQEALVEAEESKNDDMDQRKSTTATTSRSQRSESNASIDLMTAIFGEEKSESALPSKSKSSSSSSSQAVLAPKPGNSSASLSMYFT